MIHVAIIRVEENKAPKVEYYKYFTYESEASSFIQDFNSKEEHGSSYSYAKQISFKS